MNSTTEIKEELTVEQQGAFDKMLDFLKNDEYMFLLGGYAGTGKTFLIVRLIKYLLGDKGGNFKIGMSAPTNKAVRVLRLFMSMMDARVSFATIHSMLGLREQISPKGEQVFKRDYRAQVTITGYSLLIIDECSMLSDELFEYLQEYRGDLKIIFMGDPAQIPPVNKPDSLPMSMEGRRDHGIDYCMLKNIVRQKEGNPLIEVTMNIRKNLKDGNSIRIPKIKKVAEDGIEFISNYDTGTVTDLYKRLFLSREYNEDGDYAKVIAWTNRTVNYHNDKIRKLIYGEVNQKVEMNEKLIAHTPIFDDEEAIIFQTSDEFEVEEIKIQSVSIQTKSLKYYETKVGYDNYFTGQRQQKLVHILHEDSEEDFKGILDKMMRGAKTCTPGSEMARKAWVAFYKFKKVFADVKYAYAITCHKSQGSTYRNVIMIEGDINYNKRIVERNRIKYTAASRPSNNLYIIN